MPGILNTNFFRYLFIFVIFFIAAVSVHYSGLDSPMIYDSKVWVNDKAHIFSEGNLGRIVSIFPERPVFMLTLYMNHLIFGMDPFYFRLIASGFSAAAGLALLALANGIFLLPAFRDRFSESNIRLIAFFTGLLFVVHPLQSFVVLYIWQNQVALSCLFYFSALAAYLTGSAGREKLRIRWYAACAVLFFLGLLSKENSVSLPPAMLLAEFTLLGVGFGQAARRISVVGAVTLPPLAVYMLLAYWLHGQESVIPKGVIARIVEYYQLGGWSPWQIFLTECRVFFTYVASVIFPFGDNLHLVRAVQVSGSLLEPRSTLWAAAGVASWTALGIALIRRDPITSFGLLFFFLTLLPESSLIPQFLFFGYRPVLPMAGLLIAAGGLFLRAADWAEKRLPRGIFRIGFSSILFLPIAFFAWSGHIQASEWNPLKLWEKAYKASPGWSGLTEKLYITILINYGAELVNSGEFSDAVPILSRAVRLEPQSPSAHNNLANAFLGMGNVPEAIRVYQNALDSNIKAPELYMNLGVAFLKDNRIQDAKESFEKAVRLHPGLAKARANLGMVCLRLGQVSEAIEHLSHAVKINPQLALAHGNLGRALQSDGRLPEAATHYMAALKIAPGLTEDYFNLANIMVKLNDPASAIEYYGAALRLDRNHYIAENNLGSVLLSLADFSEAAKHFRRAIEIKPDFNEARMNLDTALAKLQEVGKDSAQGK